MNDNISHEQLAPRTELQFQLDEELLEHLSSRNYKQRLSENTKKSYKQVIRSFNRFAAERGLAINEDTVTQYFHSISHLSPATLNQRKYALLKMVKAQMGEGNVLKILAIEKAFESIPTYQIDTRISESKCLSEDQVAKLINAATTDRVKLIIRFLFKTGCRVSELIGVKLKECEVVGDKVEIKVLGKGKKIREVVIPKSLFKGIRRVYIGKTWLFESRGGKPLDRNNIRKQLQKTGKKLELKNMNPHMLRHTRATDLIVHKGASTKAVSQYLGHSTTAITLDMYVSDQLDTDDIFKQDQI